MNHSSFASFRRVAKRPIALLLAGALAAGAAPLALAQQPPPATGEPKVDPNEARKQLVDGDAAARSKNWAVALEHYTKSNDAMHNALALMGAANAQYQLGKLPEAYASYEDLLKTYGDKLQRPQKAEAEARLKELGTRTGLVSIAIDEPGASIAIDGRDFGKSPRTAPIRLAAGAHMVRVSKDGFVAFEKSNDVPGGGVVSVDVKLAKDAVKGTVTVREKSGQAVRVIVDGNDVGAAPWTGELDPGPHEISLRSSSSAAPAQRVDVQKGAKVDLELVAVKAGARLEVRTSDGLGNVYVDGKLVGEGKYDGDIGVGPHDIEVKREGFDPFKKSVVLADKQVYAEAVTLRRPGGGVASDAESERIFQGIYGGFGLLGVVGIGGMGTELETHCPALGASSCDTPGPMGAGAFGYVGYTFNPVGFEVMLGGLFDATNQSARFDGTAQNGGNPLLATPARTEKFKIYRMGGLGAIRVRATAQGKHIRGSIAAGLGVSYRYMLSERTATADAGGLKDADVFDGVSYFSPAISADAAIHWRLGQSTALSLGLMLWAESAGSGPATKADGGRYLGGGSATPAPIATPAYHLASSAQVFLGPYLGMQFGP